MYAALKNHRQAPRKVRLVTDMVKGKTVSEALSQLSFLPKKAAEPVSKLIKSAFANARQKNDALKEENALIKNITVDKGMTFVRFMPRARGRATPINKESSHVKVTLVEVEAKAEAKPKAAKAKKAEAK